MKVLHLINSLGFGGAENLVANLLPCLARAGIQTAVVSLRSEIGLAQGLNDCGASVYCLNYDGTIYSVAQNLRAVLSLREVVRHVRPDILHSHLWMSDIMSRVAAPFSCRLITTLHNLDPWWLEKCPRSAVKTLLDSVSGKLRNVRFISVSRDVRACAAGALRIRERKNVTVLNGIDLSMFAKAAGKKKLDKSKVIIQVGRFYPQKRHDLSLRAFAALRSHYPGIKLALVGDGPLRSELLRMADSLRLGSSIEFLGIRNDVPELLAQADIFWMPSEWEGLPIACIEAMASGLPVIATRVGGLSEVVTHGKTGFLLSPENCLAQLVQRTSELLDDTSLAKTMGSNGRAVAYESFSIEKTAAQYLSAYEQLLEGVW